MRTNNLSAWAIISWATYLAVSVSVQAGDVKLTIELVASTLDSPVFLTHAPCDFERLFVVEKPGLIRIIKGGKVLDKPFIDVVDLLVSDGYEQGLLGIAFDPDYITNGFFYIDYTREVDGAMTIARYVVSNDPDVADPNSGKIIIVIQQQGASHNSGLPVFSPHDGYFYIATGDGGGGGIDPGDDAQNLDSLLGKVLRLDVHSDDFPSDPNRNYGIPKDNPFVGKAGADEIWAYGLRNPWRYSFDRETGDLYIGDVGLHNWEEINFQPASSIGGENYGWDCKEGTHCTDEETCDCKDNELVDPLFEYAHPLQGSQAVIGGYVYRGSAIPQLVGDYIFGDHRLDNEGRVWRLRHDGTNVTSLIEIQDELNPGAGNSLERPTSFGEDAFGELYICDKIGNEIYKIVLDDEIDPDCDWDLDNNGVVGVTDILALFAQWGGPGTADFDGSGTVGTADLLILLANWGPCQ